MGGTVIVAGMHRSGTSLVTRVLNLCGLALGRDRLLMAAQPDNPQGFWESKPIVRFNDRLLEVLGGSWDDPPPLFPGWEAGSWLDPVRAQAAEVLAQVFGDDAASGGVHGWKDPRASLLLPFWRSVTPVAAVILPVRDPREVAASLAARNGLAPEQVARLWLRYTLALRDEWPDPIVVRYQDVLSDPVTIAEELVARVGDGLAVDADAVRALADPSLRHHARHDEEARGPLMRLALAVHEGELSDDAYGPLLHGLQGEEVARVVGATPGRVPRLLQELTAERDLARERARAAGVVIHGEHP